MELVHVAIVVALLVAGFAITIGGYRWRRFVIRTILRIGGWGTIGWAILLAGMLLFKGIRITSLLWLVVLAAVSVGIAQLIAERRRSIADVPDKTDSLDP